MQLSVDNAIDSSASEKSLFFSLGYHSSQLMIAVLPAVIRFIIFQLILLIKSLIDWINGRNNENGLFLTFPIFIQIISSIPTEWIDRFKTNIFQNNKKREPSLKI